MGDLAASYREHVAADGRRTDTFPLPDTLTEFKGRKKMSSGGGRCFLCEEACDALCEACGEVYFCCDDHRDLGGKGHFMVVVVPFFFLE